MPTTLPSVSVSADAHTEEQILVSVTWNAARDKVYLVFSDIGQAVGLIPRERTSLRHAVRIASNELGLPEICVDSWNTDWCVYVSSYVPNAHYFVELVIETFGILEPNSRLSLTYCVCLVPEAPPTFDCRGAQQQMVRALASEAGASY